MKSAAAISLGRRLRDLRLARGLTQADLRARMGGGTRQGYAKLEQGRCLPNIETLLFVADALGVRVTDIVSVFDEPTAREAAE